jgi:hypothetical protein
VGHGGKEKYLWRQNVSFFRFKNVFFFLFQRTTNDKRVAANWRQLSTVLNFNVISNSPNQRFSWQENEFFIALIFENKVLITFRDNASLDCEKNVNMFGNLIVWPSLPKHE